MQIEHASTINYGKLIATKRIELNITQEELAQGICSIPYLSKLENDKITANPDIIYLLCEKLDLSYSELKKNNNEVILLIQEIFLAINEDDETLVRELWDKLNQHSESIYNPELSIYFRLIEMRYRLYFKSLQKAEQIVIKLDRVCKTLNSNQLFYYYYFTGLLFLHKQNYMKGINFFKKALPYRQLVNPQDYHIIYYLSLSYSHMKSPSLAILYGLEALTFFQENLHYNRIIDCHIIIGINYTRIKQFNEAYILYEKVLRISKKKKDDKMTGKVYHNLGYLYSMQNDHESAIEWYKKSLALKGENDPMYTHTLYYLSKEYLQIDNESLALSWIEKGLHSPAVVNNQANLLKLTTLKLYIVSNTEECITFLENEVIPYFKEKNDFPTLAEYYEFLGDLYSDNYFYYKKSTHYYKQALMLKKEINFG
ncbi:tetratricopeptide repeat protein [Bifidobacterium pullorum subsp. gallinarum]